MEARTNRINVVDSLRGFAVCGIIIIHFLEHLNFYRFPELTALDNRVWDTVFFLGASKMYAIFALLFGFSCYVQHHNRESLGEDFRLRFAWRMLLLFIWGMVDLIFFNGDILCTYAVMGLLLIPFVKASDKVLLIAAIILFLQPVELVTIILALFNPSVTPLDFGLSDLWQALYVPCASGSFTDVAAVNLKFGLKLNFGWAIEHGRLTQTLFLFIVGMLLGRKELFNYSEQNMLFWRRVLFVSLAAFAIFFPAWKLLPGCCINPTVSECSDTLLNMWRNFAMMSFYVSSIVILYYRTKAVKVISPLAHFGKMSLSCYLLQSIVGGFIFYNWGIGAYRWSGHTVSLVLSIVFLALLFLFCRWWTKRHRRGPLEEVWSRATFIFH